MEQGETEAEQSEEERHETREHRTEALNEGNGKGEQADGERESLSTKIGKEAEMKGIRDGELSREVTSREVSSPTCFSMELSSEGWEGTGDDGPDPGVQDRHPPSIENRPPGVRLFSFQPQKPQKGPKVFLVPQTG